MVGFFYIFSHIGHVTRVIEILGSYSLSLKELRDILSYLYTGQMKSWVSEYLEKGKVLTLYSCIYLGVGVENEREGVRRGRGKRECVFV